METSREITVGLSVGRSWNQKDLQYQRGGIKEVRGQVCTWMDSSAPLKENLALEPPSSTLQRFWSCLRTPLRTGYFEQVPEAGKVKGFELIQSNGSHPTAL